MINYIPNQTIVFQDNRITTNYQGIDNNYILASTNDVQQFQFRTSIYENAPNVVFNSDFTTTDFWQPLGNPLPWDIIGNKLIYTFISEDMTGDSGKVYQDNVFLDASPYMLVIDIEGVTSGSLTVKTDRDSFTITTNGKQTMYIETTSVSRLSFLPSIDLNTGVIINSVQAYKMPQNYRLGIFDTDNVLQAEVTDFEFELNSATCTIDWNDTGVSEGCYTLGIFDYNEEIMPNGGFNYDVDNLITDGDNGTFDSTTDPSGTPPSDFNMTVGGIVSGNGWNASSVRFPDGNVFMLTGGSSTGQVFKFDTAIELQGGKTYLISVDIANSGGFSFDDAVYYVGLDGVAKIDYDSIVDYSYGVNGADVTTITTAYTPSATANFNPALFVEGTYSASEVEVDNFTLKTPPDWIITSYNSLTTFENDTLKCLGTGASAISVAQFPAIVEDEDYEITYNVYADGGFTLTPNVSGTDGTAVTASGVYQETITGSYTLGAFRFTIEPDNGTTVYINSISINQTGQTLVYANADNYSQTVSYKDLESATILLEWGNNTDLNNFVYVGSNFVQRARLQAKLSKPSYDGTYEKNLESSGTTRTWYSENKKVQDLVISPVNELMHDAIRIIPAHNSFYINGNKYRVEDESIEPDWSDESDYIASVVIEVSPDPGTLIGIKTDSEEDQDVRQGNSFVLRPDGSLVERSNESGILRN